MGSSHSWLWRLLPILILFAIGSLAAYQLVPYELEQMKWEISGMPESYPIEQKMRPILLLLLCYIPFLGSVIYSFLGTMDRYMSRHFITHFLLCTVILLAIYFLADFMDNSERFRNRFENPLRQTLFFYTTQLPMFLYQILPYTLLMGALWSLSRWSATCELTGMLQSGRSLLRICAPIIIFGSLAALVYGIFGFHWAPHGSLYRDLILKQERSQKDNKLLPIVYKHERSARIWNVQNPASMQNPGAPMTGIEIKQFDPERAGKVLYQMRADSAQWNKMTAHWHLSQVYIRRVAADGERPKDDEYHPTLALDFEEKPYQIISPSQSRGNESMSTSTLYDMISSGAGTPDDRARKRTEWHMRIARIFTCIIFVLLAIPSAITFQRRGTIKGVALAVLLAALMLMLYRVFNALGESRILQAWISAWIPNTIYFFITVWLFQRNLAHRGLREWLSSYFKSASHRQPTTPPSHEP